MGVAWCDRKVAKRIPAHSSRVATHLIPEVRPLPGQRAALFETARRFYPWRGTRCTSPHATRVLAFESSGGVTQRRRNTSSRR